MIPPAANEDNASKDNERYLDAGIRIKMPYSMGQRERAKESTDGGSGRGGKGEMREEQVMFGLMGIVTNERGAGWVDGGK